MAGGTDGRTSEASTMATAAKNIQAAVDEINSLQTQLQNAGDTLAGDWKGPASNAFTQATAAFIADFKAMNATLQGLQEAMVKNTNAYEADEEQAQQFIQSAGSSTNNITAALNK